MNRSVRGFANPTTWELGCLTAGGLDLCIAALFWITWAAPEILGPSWIRPLRFTMIMEFFAMFFGYFLLAFATTGSRVLRLAGTLFIASVYLGTVWSLLAGSGPWVFVPFVLQLGSKLLGPWSGSAAATNRAVDEGLNIAIGLPAFLILVGVGQEAGFVQPWGLTAEVIAQAGLPHDDEPWHNLCSGALYFTAMAVWRGPLKILAVRLVPALRSAIGG